MKGRIKKENAKNNGENENGEEEIGGGEAAEVEQELNSEKEKASSALLPGKRGKFKRKSKVKEETLDLPESPDTDDSKLFKGIVKCFLQIAFTCLKTIAKCIRLANQNQMNSKSTFVASYIYCVVYEAH